MAASAEAQALTAATADDQVIVTSQSASTDVLTVLTVLTVLGIPTWITPMCNPGSELAAPPPSFFVNICIILYAM